MSKSTKRAESLLATNRESVLFDCTEMENIIRALLAENKELTDTIYHTAPPLIKALEARNKELQGKLERAEKVIGAAEQYIQICDEQSHGVDDFYEALSSYNVGFIEKRQ